jgi:nucleotide-binding universal stress UspA family protein
MFNKILVPLDGSTAAEKAIDYARRVANGAATTLFLLRTVDAQVSVGGDPVSQSLVDREQMLCGDYLSAIDARLKPDGFIIKRIARVGDSVAEILSTADDEAVDLIVMTSHGSAGGDRLFIGRVAERVCRHARCPVLLVATNDPKIPLKQTSDRQQSAIFESRPADRWGSALWL